MTSSHVMFTSLRWQVRRTTHTPSENVTCNKSTRRKSSVPHSFKLSTSAKLLSSTSPHTTNPTLFADQHLCCCCANCESQSLLTPGCAARLPAIKSALASSRCINPRSQNEPQRQQTTTILLCTAFLTQRILQVSKRLAVYIAMPQKVGRRDP